MSPHHWFQEARREREHGEQIDDLRAMITRLEDQLRELREENEQLKRQIAGQRNSRSR